MAPAKLAVPLMEQLKKELESNGSELVAKVKALIVFKINDSTWTLDLRSGNGSLKEGGPAEGDKPDLTLTVSDENFVKMAAGKSSPQQLFLLRRLKISGSMGTAMKLQPVLDAASPKAKL